VKISRGEDIREEFDDFSVHPFEEVFLVVLISGDVPFTNIVGLMCAVNGVDARSSNYSCS
jgi:hypothetical protein